MHCIICMIAAAFLFNGSSYCQKHFEEQKKSVAEWNKIVDTMWESDAKSDKLWNELWQTLLEGDK